MATGTHTGNLQAFFRIGDNCLIIGRAGGGDEILYVWHQIAADEAARQRNDVDGDAVGVASSARRLTVGQSERSVHEPTGHALIYTRRPPATDALRT